MWLTFLTFFQHKAKEASVHNINLQAMGSLPNSCQEGWKIGGGYPRLRKPTPISRFTDNCSANIILFGASVASNAILEFA